MMAVHRAESLAPFTFEVDRQGAVVLYPCCEVNFPPEAVESPVSITMSPSYAIYLEENIGDNIPASPIIKFTSDQPMIFKKEVELQLDVNYSAIDPKDPVEFQVLRKEDGQEDMVHHQTIQHGDALRACFFALGFCEFCLVFKKDLLSKLRKHFYSVLYLAPSVDELPLTHNLYWFIFDYCKDIMFQVLENASYNNLRQIKPPEHFEVRWNDLVGRLAEDPGIIKLMIRGNSLRVVPSWETPQTLALLEKWDSRVDENFTFQLDTKLSNRDVNVSLRYHIEYSHGAVILDKSTSFPWKFPLQDPSFTYNLTGPNAALVKNSITLNDTSLPEAMLQAIGAEAPFQGHTPSPQGHEALRNVDQDQESYRRSLSSPSLSTDAEPFWGDLTPSPLQNPESPSIGSVSSRDDNALAMLQPRSSLIGPTWNWQPVEPSHQDSNIEPTSNDNVFLSAGTQTLQPPPLPVETNSSRSQSLQPPLTTPPPQWYRAERNTPGERGRGAPPMDIRRHLENYSIQSPSQGQGSSPSKMCSLPPHSTATLSHRQRYRRQRSVPDKRGKGVQGSTDVQQQPTSFSAQLLSQRSSPSVMSRSRYPSEGSSYSMPQTLNPSAFPEGEEFFNAARNLECNVSSQFVSVGLPDEDGQNGLLPSPSLESSLDRLLQVAGLNEWSTSEGSAVQNSECDASSQSERVGLPDEDWQHCLLPSPSSESSLNSRLSQVAGLTEWSTSEGSSLQQEEQLDLGDIEECNQEPRKAA